MRTRATRLSLAAIAVALVSAACGSTVPPAQRAAAARLDGVEAVTGAANADTVGASGATSAVTAAASAVAGRGPQARALAATASTLKAATADGPGVTAKTITIGVIYATNSAVAQAALGNTSATQGDVKGEAEAVIRDINNHGGVRGRQLVALFHAVDATSTATSEEVAQQACADFTQDHKVLAVFGASTPTLRSCLARLNVLNATATLSGLSDAQYAASPLYYDAQALSTDTATRNLVEALVRDNYFTPWNTSSGAPGNAPVKVGVIVPDQPQWDAVVSNVLIPRLAAHGITVAPKDVQRWHFPESTSGDGQSVAEIQSAVLRFRSDGVTHVLPMEVNSLAFFAQPAESQRYRPRYGLSTAANPQSFAGNLIPYAQLNGAMGLGWSPALDLPPAANPENGPYSGPGRAYCLKVLTDANFSFPDSTAKAVGLVVCDLLYSARDAINAIPAGAGINGPNYIRSVEGFGERFPIAALPKGRFAPGKHYPVELGYRWAFDPDCPCMHYIGGPYHLQ
jgi:hypothetical protein